MPWALLGVLLFLKVTSAVPPRALHVAFADVFTLRPVAPDPSGVDVAPLLCNRGVRVNDQAVFLPFPVPAVVTP